MSKGARATTLGGEQAPWIRLNYDYLVELTGRRGLGSDLTRSEFLGVHPKSLHYARHGASLGAGFMAKTVLALRASHVRFSAVRLFEVVTDEPPSMARTRGEPRRDPAAA